MPDYQKGKIYKIVNDSTEDVYYGATCQEFLRIRLHEHKSSESRGIKITSNILFYGENVRIELVERCPCSNRYELSLRERFYIVNNKCSCFNVPFIIKPKQR